MQNKHTHVTNTPDDHSGAGTTTPRGLSSHRVEALADGVFAIAMTLLVFNVHLPPDWEKAQVGTKPLGPLLQDIFIGNGQSSVLIAYVMSFMLLGVHWVSHHAHFQYIRRVNRTLLWINILFFMFIAFIPFTTQLVGSRRYNWDIVPFHSALVNVVAVVFYGIDLIAISAIVYLHWWYGSRQSELTDGPLDPHIVRTASRRILTMPVLCLFAMALACINPLFSLIGYLLLPLHFPGPHRPSLARPYPCQKARDVMLLGIHK